MLARALRSVAAQSRPVDQLEVVYDERHLGASYTRNEAWQKLATDYVAFLDDDDEWLPQHVDRLLAVALETGADMVYPWFTVIGGGDPFPQYFGAPFDPDDPCQTTITCLWRRSALEIVGGFLDPGQDAGEDGLGHRRGEDMRAVERLAAAGGKIVHLPERTWLWHHHATNTSGLPERWAA